MAAAYIAAGIDPKSSIIFAQSQCFAHAQLAWILNCVARLGWLNRMTQFKEKAGKNRENASIGLYAYPVLMAADILAYKGTHVPVGEDQKQHLELARDIAQKFNNDYGVKFFPLPEPVIGGPATRVMSLRDGTKKMSKSDESDYSRINMTDDAETIALKFRKAKTDPNPLPGPETLDEHGHVKADADAARPEAFNLLSIYAALSDITLADAVNRFAGQEFSSFKGELTDLAVAKLGPINAEMKRLLAHRTRSTPCCARAPNAPRPSPCRSCARSRRSSGSCTDLAGLASSHHLSVVPPPGVGLYDRRPVSRLPRPIRRSCPAPAGAG